MARYNDIDPKKWRDYEEILTTSLWSLKRENSGVHNASYHGNFIPQVPRQLFSRYTKKDDWILDPFMGSGTSLIEAQRMGRNSIGIELQHDVAKEVHERLKQEYNPDCSTNVIVGNSKSINNTYNKSHLYRKLNIKSILNSMIPAKLEQELDFLPDALAKPKKIN